MKRLLVIGYVWPEPNSSAAGARMLQLLKSFQQSGYHITYATPAEPSAHAVELEALGIVPKNIALNCTSFDTFVQSLQPDCVLFDRFMMEEQFGWRVEKHCPNAVRILDTEDIHSLRHARHKALKQARQMEHGDALSDIAIREIAAIYRCDITLVISEYEMTWLREQYQIPSTILHYCPFMLNTLPNPVPTYTERQHFISIGNFRHEPNWDAVRFLKERIWPDIRHALPQAELPIHLKKPLNFIMTSKAL